MLLEISIQLGHTPSKVIDIFYKIEKGKILIKAFLKDPYVVCLAVNLLTYINKSEIFPFKLTNERLEVPASIY